MIVISSIIFACIYVGLIVRDECQRSVKNQVSKVEQVDFATGSWLSHEKQSAKELHVEHMKDENSGQTIIFAIVLLERPTHEGSAKVSIWQKVVLALPNIYPHYIYPHNP